MTGIMNFSLEDACLIVVTGISAVAKRSTMIYDLCQFIPRATKAEIRAAMHALSTGKEPKIQGCNCGCRGDWDLRDYVDIELDRLFYDHELAPLHQGESHS